MLNCKASMLMMHAFNTNELPSLDPCYPMRLSSNKTKS